MSSLSQINAILRFVKLTENTPTPTRGSPKPAGLDLYSACGMAVRTRGKVLILTDLQIQLPEVCYVRITPRSGLALNHRIDLLVGGGILDQACRGNVGEILYNHSDIPFIVSGGDCNAQLICQ